MARIGIFDSGIGGLTIATQLVKLMPAISISYVADDLFFPYGEKSDREIIERSDHIVKELLEVGVDLIVVACNSATAGAIATLRERFPLPFVGVEPFLNIANHQEFKGYNGHSVVLTTEATGRSFKFQDLKKRLDPQGEIDHYAFPKLASLVESLYRKGSSSNLVEEIKSELSPLKGGGYSHAILGCTHYPFISDFIAEFLDVICVDPAIYVARRVQSLLNPVDKNESGENQIMFTQGGSWDELNTKLLSSGKIHLA